jgi:hypothetical protein
VLRSATNYNRPQCVNDADDHGAGSCEPNGYRAVSSQRAIGVGNFLGNSENPTALRL